MALTAEVTTLEENRVRLDVEVPEDEVQKRMDRAVQQLAREIRIPGFRPGKAPAAAVVQRVGRDAVVQEMLKGSLGEWYSQAVAETGVQPISGGASNSGAASAGACAASFLSLPLLSPPPQAAAMSSTQADFLMARY